MVNLEDDLKEIAGAGVLTNDFERWFYRHDITTVPGWITGMLDTQPAAVVRPTTPLQVAQVLGYCSKHSLRVTPRGAGSSGLAAAIPKKGGIVVELTDLARVIDVNVDKLEVTAEAGLTWWEMERYLNASGLTLRSYPSSARSATLGGWLMTSGLGIGSLKWGPLSTQTVKVQVALPDGELHEYKPGEGLEPFLESEGTLGIVTRMTLTVRKLPEQVSHHLIGFSNVNDLASACRFLAQSQPVPYSLELTDASYLSLVKAAGYEVADPVPAGGMLLVTFDGSVQDVAKGKASLAQVVRDYRGEERAGDREWNERFNMLRVRRAVPSLIPSSVYVPLDGMARFFQGVAKLKKRPIGVLGHVVSRSEVNLLPMIAADEDQQLDYLFALHTPREVSNLAIRLGGKPGGGVGVWNAPYFKKVLGKRLDGLRAAKSKLDPNGIMNPGMWSDPPILFHPTPYQAAMTTAHVIDRVLPAKGYKARAGGFKGELNACVQCGYCMNYCPTRLGPISSTPKGRVLATRRLFMDRPEKHADLAPEYLSRIYQCTICGRCRVDCSVDIKSRPMWLGVREHLARNGLELESLRSLKKLIEETHNIAGRPNQNRVSWASRVKLPFDLTTKRTAETVYFVGCVGSFFPMVQPSVRAFAQVLSAAGIDFAIAGGEEWCCGFPLTAAGYPEAAGTSMKHNVQRVKEMGAKNVVVACPGCYRIWKEEYRGLVGENHPFQVYNSTELLIRLIQDHKLNLKKLETSLTYHDPCDLGRNGGMFDEPRYILGHIPGANLVELENKREYCTCCGSGGDLLASNQDLSLAIAGRKVEEIRRTGTETVVTACPSCIRGIYMAKTAAKVKLDVLDITELVARAL